MKKRVLGLMLAVFIALPTTAFAGAPLDTVKGHVNKVVDILRDPNLQGAANKKKKKDRIRPISEKMFDFNELSRRTLGQNWGKLSPVQQKEFVDLYKLLLEDTYADKITSYTDEEVTFTKESQLSEKTYEIKSNIARRSGDVPVDYRVINREGEWRIYDVVIEGVSLINNYRTQFREILANKSPEALLETLRKKVGKS